MISRYRIESELGRGGMGMVYACTDTALKRKVAVKVLLEEASADTVKRFQTEARAMAGLKSRHIVEVLDFGVDKERLFLVMEHLEGISLDQKLERGELDLEECLEIMYQVAKGLGDAHKNGIVHRDLKPSNVFLTEDEKGNLQIKLIDFGIAKIEKQSQTITATGAIVGTPSYVSPEGASGLEVGLPADLYSFGCLLYEMLTGDKVFKGDSALETITMHVNEPPPNLADRKDLEIPRELCALVSKCLEKAPADRHPSMKEIETDLLKMMESDTGPPAEEAKTKEETPGEFEGEDAKKATFILPLLAILSLAFLILVSFVWFSQPPEPTDSTSSPASIDRSKPKKGESLTESNQKSNSDSKTPFVPMDEIRNSEEVPAVAQQTMIGVPGIVMEYFEADEDQGLNRVLPLVKSNTRLRIKRATFKNETKEEGAGEATILQPNLVHLRLDNCILPESAVRRIASLKKLEILDLVHINDFPLEHLRLLQSAPALKKLRMRNMLIDDKYIDVLADFPNLHSLKLDQSKGYTGKNLNLLKKLNRLNLGYGSYQPKYLGRLSSLKRLRVLGLDQLTISSQNLEALQNAPLIELSLYGCKFNDHDGCAKIISRMPKLQNIYISQNARLNLSNKKLRIFNKPGAL